MSLWPVCFPMVRARLITLPFVLQRIGTVTHRLHLSAATGDTSLFAFRGMKVHLVASLASLLWVIGTGREATAATSTEAKIGWASTTEVIAYT